MGVFVAGFVVGAVVALLALCAIAWSTYRSMLDG